MIDKAWRGLIRLCYFIFKEDPCRVCCIVVARRLEILILNCYRLRSDGEIGLKVVRRGPFFDQTVFDLSIDQPLLSISRRSWIFVELEMQLDLMWSLMAFISRIYSDLVYWDLMNGC